MVWGLGTGLSAPAWSFVACVAGGFWFGSFGFVGGDRSKSKLERDQVLKIKARDDVERNLTNEGTT